MLLPEGQTSVKLAKGYSVKELVAELHLNVTVTKLDLKCIAFLDTVRYSVGQRICEGLVKLCTRLARTSSADRPAFFGAMHP